MAKLADEMHPKVADTVDKFLFGIIAVSGQMGHLRREQGTISPQVGEVPIHASFVFPKLLDEGGGNWRLLHRQMIGRAIVDVNHGEFGKFQFLF